ncbi:ParB/RepB/Spo0J family partition protein [Streptomyces xanthophaeus]|uniref:ParB/RepB/Spo0J family partition protein n=1 Tax=Streptomyces xanthophaeus TaxID=67385 RepID=UPI0026480786|nr:transcriptional regulator [Streptomyces xanthophaeus]WKD33866.1 ParB N-terminal domain-containing protein [Streptomyces xanthophaeus]
MTVPPRGRTAAEHLLALRDELPRLPVESVPVKALKISGSPRSRTESPEHARTLLEAGDRLPPVLVHHPSMVVIDGIHRVRAAEMRGRATIPVRFFRGSTEEGRLLAVALNVTHGLPLSLAERTAAAERILAAHPTWSDRSVAAVAGLSAGRTAALRRRLLGTPGPGAVRVGRDGRARPLDPSRGRELAASLIRSNPQASLREIAKEAGISPATVAKVRDHLAREDGTTVPPEGSRAAQASGASRATGAGIGRGAPAAGRGQPSDLGEIHRLLRGDPSLRFTESGRSVLRLLDSGAAVALNRAEIAASLPAHCKTAVAQLARAYAQSWQLLANEVAR